MKKYLLATVLLTCTFFTFSQGVSINQTGNPASADAILDISDTTMGLLIPRMTQVQRNNIGSPSTSLLIYQTDADSGFYFYDGNNWTPFLIGGAAANSGWTTTGNAGTSVGTNFLGTTDAEDFAIHTNNMERLRIGQGGNVGIGVTAPQTKMHIVGSDGATSSYPTVGTKDFIVVENNANSNIGIIMASGASGAYKWYIDGGATHAAQLAYTNSSKRVYFENNSVVSMNIDSIGNVGIGTNAPTVGLHVTKKYNATGVSIMAENTDQNYVAFSLRNPTSQWNLSLRADSSDFNIENGFNSTIPFTIDQRNSNIGIMEGNPKSQLHITDLPASMGSFPLDTSDAIVRIEESAGTVYMDGNAIASNVSNGLFLGNVANGPIVMGTNNTARMWVKGDGNVGIGTSVPQGNLQINDADAETYLTIGEHNGSTKDSTGFSIAPWSDGSVYIDTKIGTGGKLRFRYGEGAATGTGNSWMTMDGGNVGFNTTTPRGRFDVDGAGNIYLVDDLVNPGTQNAFLPGSVNFIPWNGAGISYLNAYNSPASGNTKFRFRVLNGGANLNAMEIASNGFVGIGTTGPTHRLHVTGVARSTQATWATTSDKRVKTNIENLNEGLNTILKIRPVEFEYSKKYRKHNEGYEGKKRGFIAQEVREVLPDMVTIIEEKIGNDTIEDFHLLSNNDFTPLLVKAIQEQQVLIDKLQTENAALKAQQKKDRIEFKAEIEAIKMVLDQSTKK